MKTSIMLLLAAVLGFGQAAHGQDRAFVRIDTNYPAAVLYADSARVGIASAGLLSVPVSSRAIRLVPPEVDVWSVAPVSKNVDLAAGDTVEITLDFPYHYRVESIPFDSVGYVESGEGLERIGSTPLLYTSDRPIEGKLLVERPGYVIERIDPGSNVWNRYVVELSPSDDLDPTAAQVHWKPPKRHRTWIDYAALGTAVAAGAFAVHYKFKADDLYSDYEATGDRSLRSDIKAYDLRSGVALGVMQAGIGVFAIRLALR